jgi:hypothetical protein
VGVEDSLDLDSIEKEGARGDVCSGGERFGCDDDQMGIGRTLNGTIRLVVEQKSPRATLKRDTVSRRSFGVLPGAAP